MAVLWVFNAIKVSLISKTIAFVGWVLSFSSPPFFSSSFHVPYSPPSKSPFRHIQAPSPPRGKCQYILLFHFYFFFLPVHSTSLLKSKFLRWVWVAELLYRRNSYIGCHWLVFCLPATGSFEADVCTLQTPGARAPCTTHFPLSSFLIILKIRVF